MTEITNEQPLDWWVSPVRNLADVAPVLAALTPYAPRSALRNTPARGDEMRHEQVHDRLIECLAHRLHAIFKKHWDPNEAPLLEPKELPMLTGSGACIISLANALNGWPGRRIASFHEHAKAGTILGHVDLELTACWVLRQRLGITDDKAKLDMLIDPSSLGLLLNKLVTPEHEARNQMFDLQQATQEMSSQLKPSGFCPRL